jgi:hypothetical protein
MFEKFGYRDSYERSGRTGMEKHYRGHTWEDHFSEQPDDLSVQSITWAHWCPHRALHWRHGVYRPLSGSFVARLREVRGSEQGMWKGLTTDDGRLFGDAVVRPHDRWSPLAGDDYVLDLWVHPAARDSAARLYDAVIPRRGHVQTFLDGTDDEWVTFFEERGFVEEANLRDDFNHHEPTTPDIRVFGADI